MIAPNRVSCQWFLGSRLQPWNPVGPPTRTQGWRVRKSRPQEQRPGRSSRVAGTGTARNARPGSSLAPQTHSWSAVPARQSRPAAQMARAGGQGRQGARPVSDGPQSLGQKEAQGSPRFPEFLPSRGCPLEVPENAKDHRPPNRCFNNMVIFVMTLAPTPSPS